MSASDLEQGHTYIGMLITDGGQLLSCLRYNKLLHLTLLTSDQRPKVFQTRTTNYNNCILLRSVKFGLLETETFFTYQLSAWQLVKLILILVLQHLMTIPET